MLLSSNATTLTAYGGVHEIGGNKFLIEDRGTKIFLDFGMQMGKFNQYFAEFVNPRKCNGMGDLFEFELLPKLKGLYRKDYSKHIGFGGDEETDFDAVLLSHSHIDHCAYIHYLRPDIPIYCSEASKLIMQALQDTGSKEEYIECKDNFQIYKNKKGEYSRKSDSKVSRNIKTFDNIKSFNIDSIEIQPVYIDHSIPGVCGFIIHTSHGSIGYTADIRFHGRRVNESVSFVDKCKESELSILLCEGTRITETNSVTESDIEVEIKEIVSKTKHLIVCTYPTRDLDRLLSFYNAAKDSNRTLVIDLKQAYLLKLFQTSDKWKSVYPSPTDKNLNIYLPRKDWGLVDKDVDIWTKKVLLEDYDLWAREFVEYPNSVTHLAVNQNQKDMIFYCNDFHVQELIDVRPKELSSYIRSSTEPFDDEMVLELKRVERWLLHFGLIQMDDQLKHIHVSGHGSGDQLKSLIQNCSSKKLIPIHTVNEEYHKKWHDDVLEIDMKKTVNLL